MSKILKQIGWVIAILAVVAIFIMLFTGIVQTGMVYFSGKNGTALPDTVIYGISGTLGCGLSAILIWLIIKYSARLRFYRCANPQGVAWTTVFILMTLCICRIVLPGIWAYASYAMGVPHEEIGMASDEPLWQSVIFGVILAPVLEELLFRKDIFSLLKMRFSMGWTIGLSSILFAALHGYSTQGFVSCLLAGILFAILMARTGSLLPCIIAHLLSNLESFYYNATESTNPLIVNLNGHTTYNTYIFAAGLLIAVIAGTYLYKNRTSHSPSN